MLGPPCSRWPVLLAHPCAVLASAHPNTGCDLIHSRPTPLIAAADYALEQPDTYLVSIRQLLAWMQVRLPLDPWSLGLGVRVVRGLDCLTAALRSIIHAACGKHAISRTSKAPDSQSQSGKSSPPHAPLPFTAEPRARRPADRGAPGLRQPWRRARQRRRQLVIVRCLRRCRPGSRARALPRAWRQEQDAVRSGVAEASVRAAPVGQDTACPASGTSRLIELPLVAHVGFAPR